jgi:hypothetical protein
MAVITRGAGNIFRYNFFRLKDSILESKRLCDVSLVKARIHKPFRRQIYATSGKLSSNFD